MNGEGLYVYGKLGGWCFCWPCLNGGVGLWNYLDIDR